MYQISYASRATVQQPEILDQLRDILTVARNFNYRHSVTGVLYYADGQFFQCLEGEKKDLDVLIEKLNKDKRHQDVVFFEYKTIESRQFSDWSMKYVSRNSAIQHYLSELGYSAFDPLQLNQNQVDGMLDLLVQIYDAMPA